MSELPKSQHRTEIKIYDWYASQRQPPRQHLGASIIGHACDRYLWLTFRWAAEAKFEGRILRLFGTGKREEARVYEELRAIGVEVHTEENGSQINCRDASGHFGGSVDAIVRGLPEAPLTWAVLEIKTHNTRSFADVKKRGVLESKPQHFAQTQIYMSLLKLERALYFAVCKDTDEIYTEWLHADASVAENLTQRANNIICAKEPPAKISDDPAYYLCKMCPMYAQCHNMQTASVNCRTCVNVTQTVTQNCNGSWTCEHHNITLTADKQQEGCDQHLFIPSLIPYGHASDAGEGWIEYEHAETGKTFRNGAAYYKSSELSISPAKVVIDPFVAKLKTELKATITKVTKKPRKAVDLSSVTTFFDDPIPF